MSSAVSVSINTL